MPLPERGKSTYWPAVEKRLQEAEALLHEVSESAPRKQGQYTFRAGVRWDIIHRVREHLRNA